jgi:hypothetical protein
MGFSEFFQQPFFSQANGAGGANGQLSPSMTGMTPQSFGSIMGQIGSALGDEGSWQKQLGNVAAQMGQQQILAEAEKNKAKMQQSLLDRLFPDPNKDDGVMSKIKAAGIMPPKGVNLLTMKPNEITTILPSLGGN